MATIVPDHARVARLCPICGVPFVVSPRSKQATCGHAYCRKERQRQYNRSYYLENRGATVTNPIVPREA